MHALIAASLLLLAALGHGLTATHPSVLLSRDEYAAIAEQQALECRYTIVSQGWKRRFDDSLLV